MTIFLFLLLVTMYGLGIVMPLLLYGHLRERLKQATPGPEPPPSGSSEANRWKTSVVLPFKGVDIRELGFWKLQFILKWQTEYNNPDKMKPLIDKLKAAFTELNYEEPGNEAVLLNHVIESVSTEILKGNMDQSSSFMEFLLKKYGV